MEKICLHCGGFFIATKYDPNRQQYCSRKCREAARRKNPEYQQKQRERQRRWRENNREHCINYQREYQPEWRSKNREKCRESALAHYYKHRDRNVERVKAHNLKAHYGLTKADVGRMTEAQSGRCAICGRVPPRLVVDHDHETGKVRQLLCDRCNGLLGHLENNPDLLEKMESYLAVHRSVEVN